ncbi:MAG: CoB--CoM heterodisulfide reductase iron-sulfur subunit B family protein [Deltaproteobacteria bacterium]|nr:CoB--CoM heterodisulfide reductase iron-sulfur subunit B family protein [Deltaproteobacteria bacterium]MBW2346872.1 CoB--CoM heterodisulfide reductase iron-sulfur subunit B family protein [Deltaproteobacteria bacterium]RLB40398.1 MAG: hypothetical protein DRH20_01510 [Deltaproteobacteria bacterium]
MNYALFLGCTIPARSRNYEMSARRVAEKVGLSLVDVEEFVCCGFPAKNSDREFSETLGGYNLALAQQRGMDICVLCSSCASALTETAHRLSSDPRARDRVNGRIAAAGLRYDGDVRVRHFARLLLEDVAPETITSRCERDLTDLRVAVHYGCHYLKPSEIYDGFDDVEAPDSVEALLRLAGVDVVDYPSKKMCCGGPVLPVDEKLALAVAHEKLTQLRDAGAEALCLVCPFCSVMYDGNQKGIESEFDESYGLPVLYLTQILGLAMGFGRKELGLNMNVVKTKKLLARYFE